MCILLLLYCTLRSLYPSTTIVNNNIIYALCIYSAQELGGRGKRRRYNNNIIMRAAGQRAADWLKARQRTKGSVMRDRR